MRKATTKSIKLKPYPKNSTTRLAPTVVMGGSTAPLARAMPVLLMPASNHPSALQPASHRSSRPCGSDCCRWPAIKVTPGNVDERKGLLAIASGLFGTMYADKGYGGKEFVQKMKDKGIDLVTRVRKNMKEVMHCEFDKVLLRKRSLVETVFDELKNQCQIEHTRHRSLSNFAVNLMADIVAYCLSPVKPRICSMGLSGPLAVN